MNLDDILAAQLSVLDGEFSSTRIYEDFWGYLSSATDSIEVEAVFEAKTKIDVLIVKRRPNNGSFKGHYAWPSESYLYSINSPCSYRSPCDY